MKILRYRIRAVTLLLVTAILALLLWTVRASWIPSLFDSMSPDTTADPSVYDVAVPSASSVPDIPPSASPAAEPISSPEPLYDTFGL